MGCPDDCGVLYFLKDSYEPHGVWRGRRLSWCLVLQLHTRGPYSLGVRIQLEGLSWCLETEWLPQGWCLGHWCPCFSAAVYAWLTVMMKPSKNLFKKTLTSALHFQPMYLARESYLKYLPSICSSLYWSPREALCYEKEHRERRRERHTSMLHFPAMFGEAWARRTDHTKRQHASLTTSFKDNFCFVRCSGRICVNIHVWYTYRYMCDTLYMYII